MHCKASPNIHINHHQMYLIRGLVFYFVAGSHTFQKKKKIIVHTSQKHINLIKET